MFQHAIDARREAPAGAVMSEGEWQARVDLAAAYRLDARHGWDDLIYTHISLRVPNLEDAVKRLREGGVKPINQEPGVGAGGHRYVFIHPSSAGGVLLELVEAFEPQAKPEWRTVEEGPTK